MVRIACSRGPALCPSPLPFLFSLPLVSIQARILPFLPFLVPMIAQGSHGPLRHCLPDLSMDGQLLHARREADQLAIRHFLRVANCVRLCLAAKELPGELHHGTSTCLQTRKKDEKKNEDDDGTSGLQKSGSTFIDAHHFDLAPSCCTAFFSTFSSFAILCMLTKLRFIHVRSICLFLYVSSLQATLLFLSVASTYLQLHFGPKPSLTKTWFKFMYIPIFLILLFILSEENPLLMPRNSLLFLIVRVRLSSIDALYSFWIVWSLYLAHYTGFQAFNLTLHHLHHRQANITCFFL